MTDAAEPRPLGTFLLGVGCQKGGTSWLHDYLAGSPQSDMGFVKEYHLFDVLDLPSERWKHQRIIDSARRALDAMSEGRRGKVDALRRALFQSDPATYFDYFATLLRRPGVRLTADITPSYSGLSAERLTSIRRELEARGVRPVVGFVMRDPVDRLWSQIRMYQQRMPEKYDGPGPDWVLRSLDDGHVELRTRYDLTLAAIDASFPADQTFLTFYERLFDEDVLRSLSASLGIDYRTPELARRVNSSPTTEPLPDSVARTVAQHYAPVYEAVASRFDVDLTRLWPSSRFL